MKQIVFDSGQVNTVGSIIFKKANRQEILKSMILTEMIVLTLLMGCMMLI
jgi:hypothetical protein